MQCEEFKMKCKVQWQPNVTYTIYLQAPCRSPSNLFCKWLYSYLYAKVLNRLHLSCVLMADYPFQQIVENPRWEFEPTTRHLLHSDTTHRKFQLLAFDPEEKYS